MAKTMESKPGLRERMETALKGGVTSIVAECGGGCTCATCHVYVDDAWRNKIPPASADEEFEPASEARIWCTAAPK